MGLWDAFKVTAVKFLRVSWSKKSVPTVYFTSLYCSGDFRFICTMGFSYKSKSKPETKAHILRIFQVAIEATDDFSN